MKPFILMIRSPSVSLRNHRPQLSVERDLKPFKSWLKSMQDKGQILNYLRLDSVREIISSTGSVDHNLVEWVEGGQVNHVLFSQFPNREAALQMAQSCPFPAESWTMELSEIMP
jgi:hypothetical protein